jgi:malic enzyme
MGRRKSLVPPDEQKLTRREELFVKIIVSEDGLVTQREAAVRAGVPACSAHSRSTEMMKRPRVARAIAQYRAELDAQYAVTYKRSERDLKVMGRAALEAGNYGAAIQSEIARGKLAGLYTNKSELRVGSIDALSREECERELNAIRRSFGKIIDVTPEKEEAASTTHRGGTLEVIDAGTQNDESDSGTNKVGE